MLSKRRLLSALAVAALLPASAVADASTQGEQLFQQHCAKCHGSTGQANTWRGWLFFAKNLSKPSWQNSVSDDEITQAIKQGPGVMPAYADSLSSDEQQNILKFVRTLGN